MEKGANLTEDIDTPYIWDMALHTPKEPEHVREWIRTMEQVGGVKTPGVKWDHLNIWYGNQLPKYLWDEWKNDLKPRGFTWQKFLSLLRHRTDAALLWYKGHYTWERFIKETINLIDGPLGQEIAKR